MTLRLGDTLIAGNSVYRNVGEIIQSTIPLTDAGLHLLDGSIISSGSYSRFVNYISGLVSSYPDLFCSESDWQASITNHGVCGKFVYDSTNNTVRLPKITGFVEGTTDVTALGDLIQAGLPNITGFDDMWGVGTGTDNPSGACKKRATGVNADITRGGGQFQTYLHEFDASGSSSIYGNSTTVQPQSIKVLYYICIASCVTNNLNIDVADMANKDLSNLTSQGKNIANWSSNVTNCITEIPQDIKLELNNGTLTLKTGSKVYAPNGVSVFDVVTISADKTETASSMGLTTGSALVFARIDTQDMWAEVLTESGTGTPTNPWTTYYNTNDNKIYRYTTDITTTVYQGTFPVAKISFSTGTITSIDQVFNGFGYIGSTVFALPGVKGLIPNGRNEDGSLKNIEFTTSNVLTWTPSWTGNGTIVLDSAGIYINGSLDEKYDEQTNFTSFNGVIHSFCFCGSCTLNNGVISNFTSKTAFHTLDYNDSSTISGWSMPSSRYIDLTVGASGATYTAPANGHISMVMADTVSGNMGYFAQLYDNGVEIRRFGNQSTSGAYHVFTLNFEIRKGQVFSLSYYGSTPNFFRFIYAKGEQ